jgi:nitroreductase
MDTLTAIKQRRCVRKFSGDEPGEEQVRTLLEAAIRAPSAGNLQPWHFYVVRDRAVREELSAAALSQGHVAQAPVVVVVCADPDTSGARYGKRGRKLYCIQDTAAATQNLLLAATALGLAACWVGAFDEGRVARIVRAPKGRRPLAMVPVGYAARPGRGPTPRLPLEQVTTFIG